ncbi:MAG: retroviral-like aspartic protease family protein [Candidatus Obscuribacterales bacterium]|nr:retroviral-like aspartic protease family protein [Candidatus Obscuribacterales bacterium]
MLYRLLTTALLLILATPPSPAQESYWSKGVQLYRQQNFKSALPYFQAAQQKDQTGDAMYYAGLCQQQLGEISLARATWYVTASRFPNTAAALAASRALAQLSRVYPQSPATPATNTRTTPASPTQIVEVPFSRLATGQILVSGAVNGQPVDMMFDTGASDCFFKQKDFEKIGIAVPASGAKKRYLGIGGEVSATVVPVNLTVGTLTRQVAVSVQDPDYQRTSAGNDNNDYPLLGQNFFGDLTYQLDFAHDVIRFLPSSNSVPEDSVPFQRDGNNLVVTVKVNGRECQMIMDTGADSVCFTDKQLAGLGVERPTNANSGVSEGVGGQRVSYVFSIDSIKLGPIEKKNVTSSVALNSDMDKPLLGASFLRGLVITINPTNCTVSVSR